MSARNSRAAKAGRRAARATAYPRMPYGTCYVSARLCAALYPELRYAQGDWTVSFADGEVRVIRHAWCVAPAGRIVDPTAPPLRPDVTCAYEEKPGHKVDWPENWDELVELVRHRTAGLPSEAKRKEIEAAGEAFRREHEKQIGRPYRSPWDRRYVDPRRVSSVRENFPD